jgi:hypothetical protein
MTTRKTIRPVTLRRVVEICSLASISKGIDVLVASQKLGVSNSRAEEIVLEVEKMGLLTRFEKSYLPNDKTAQFLGNFENEQWERIHGYFLKNYIFYQDFIFVLESHINDEKGLTIDEIKIESENRQLSLNQTAIEVLSDWCDRLGIIQRHLYNRRLYLARMKPEPQTFKNALAKHYQEVSRTQLRRGIFVEIPMIREDLCERLKIARKAFDESMRAVYLENVGRMELSGAPIITLAKKSPLSERKIKRNGKAAILSPKYEIQKDREGLSVGQKTYYYMAIHEEI